MDALNTFRLGLRQVLQHYNTGIWLQDLGVAWANVLGRTSVPLQTVVLQAGYQDHIPLVEKCGFCQMIPQPGMPPRTILRSLDPLPEVEQLARQLRADSVLRYEHVSVSKIVSDICQKFNVPSFDWFSISMSSVPTLQQLTELEAKVYNFTSTFLSTRPVTTLYDLQQQLCLALKVSDFSHLELGPLLRNPVIIQSFKPPADRVEVPKVTLSDVVNAVKHLLTHKNPQVQPHAVLQWLTRKFDVDMPRDLCVKVESTAGLVMLVSDHQRDEELVNRAVKEKLLMAVHKDASKLVLEAPDPDVNLEVLRQMNAAMSGLAAAHKADHVIPRGITSKPPAPVKPVSFLHDFRSDARVPYAAWAEMRRKNDSTCEALMAACKHRPVVFSLTLLSKALCDSRKRQEGLPNNRKLHAAWVQFWNTDVLAGLVLRAQAELMYEPAALSILPQPLTAPVTDDATDVCAAMLHLSPQEFTWSALYVHFLAQTRSCLLQLDKGDLKVNLQDLGKYLSGIFQPSLSRAAAKPKAAEAGEALAYFWSNDALAMYLLWSLVKLTGRDYDPQWPDTPEFRESTPDISASNVPRTPLTVPRPVALAPTSIDAPIVLDDAESDPPFNPHWLLKHAPGALNGLSSQLSSLEHYTAASAISAVERVAQRIRDKDNATWQFLRKFASLPEDKSLWDADASAKVVNGMEEGTAAEGHSDVSPEQTKPTGKEFKSISAQQFHAVAAQLYAGSTPAQLASLERVLQARFNAPSFSALGHGPSFLQACSEDEVIMQIVSAAAATFPLSKVLMVTQQAAQALKTDSLNDDQQVNIVDAVAACLCEHFRVVSVEALGHGNAARLISLAQAQADSTPQKVLSAAALAACSGSTYASNAGQALGRPSTAEDARKCLLKAPMLSELHDWSSWHLLFELELGSLSSFLQEQEMVSALELSAGKLVKIAQHASSEDYSSFLSQRDATGVVAVLLGIVATHRGVQHAPVAMLAARTKAQLAAMDSDEAVPGSDGSSTGRGLPRAAIFVLECLEKLPEPFQVTLGQPMLLQPLVEVAESAAYAEQSLLKAAVTSSQHAVLHRLGFQLGVTLWQDAWRRAMLPPPPQPQPFTTALVSAAASTHQPAQAGTVHAVLDQLLGRDAPQLQGSIASGILNSISHDAVSPMQTDATSAPGAVAGQQSASVSPEDESQRCMAIVNQIRREEFGMNVELDAASSQLRHRQNERIGRALQRLSQELYSKDTHFVLELVQNADDNSYPAGVLPALEFILQDTGITVLNNEVGFSESNIRALCDVGRTTKKHTVGYIGQKGIGFKSVFKITDAPQIHSRGFHVAFDLMQHSALGYVLPTWVEDAPDISSVSKLGSHQTTTKVFLPFKQGSQQQAASLRHKFDDVRPTLLLFLQRLQCIVVNDATAGEASIMVRRSLGNGLVELRHGANAEHASRWLQVSHTFQPSVPRLDVQLEQTTVSLAFNLEGEAPMQQQVYAFLPLRSYGLSFIVQADFIVPSSREAIDCDSAWNELLREQVPNLFLQSLQSFKQLAVPTVDQPMAWVNRWLQSVPLPREAQSFFAALPHSLAARLQQSQCIPTETSQWVFPREALVCQDPQVRSLLADPRLPAIVTLQYAHSDLSVLHSSQPLRALLGVSEVAHSHLLDVVRQLYTSHVLAQMGSAWLAQLLLCVFDSLQQERPGGMGYQTQSSVAVASAAAKAATAELRKLLLLPMSDGTFAVVDDDMKQPLYFPLDMGDKSQDGEESVAAVTSKQRELLNACNLHLRVLDPAFLDAVGQDRKPVLIRALENLGLKHIMLPDIICHHVLPALPACDEASHIAYLALIISSGLTAPEALNASLSSKIISKLKAHGKVVTNHGIKQLEEAFLHLPVNLGNKIDLVKLFPQHQWHFPSDAYLASEAGSSAAWRTLFKALGFTDFIQVPTITVRFTDRQKAASLWADSDLGTPDDSGSFTLQDWSAVEFKAVVQSLLQHCKDEDSVQLHCGHLAHHMDALWEDEYAGCTSAHVLAQAEGMLRQPEQPSSSQPLSAPSIPTSFSHALQSLTWLPSSLGGVQRPSSLFNPNSHAMTLLGHHVPYLACPIKEPSLLAALRVITEITWQHVLRMLSSWSALSSFTSSVEQMSNIYTFLAAAMEREQGAADAICAAFACTPLIWLPLKASLAEDSKAAPAETPFQRGSNLVPYEVTPLSTCTRRKAHKKVNFMTPGTQAKGGHSNTPAAPAYTPYTLTPGWPQPAASRQAQGQFYAATGGSIRLWDLTGVIEGIPVSKLSIRILGDVYSSDAVMSFFAEGLVYSSSVKSSPACQLEGLNARLNAVQPAAASGTAAASQQHQRPPGNAQTKSAVATAVRTRPARAASTFDQEDYIDLISSDEEDQEVSPEQDQDGMERDAAPGTAHTVTAAAEQHQTNTAAGAAQQQPVLASDAAQRNAGDGLDPAQDKAAAHASQPPPTPASPQAQPLPLPQPQSIIPAQPTCKEYCQALAAIAEPVPPVLHAAQLSQVLAILNRWSSLIANGTMGEADIDALRQMLLDVKAFPVAGQQWASLSDGLIINDEPAVAALFREAKGVALLHLPDKSGELSPYSELEPLLTALHVPHISKAVQQSVLPVTGWSGSVELDPIIADCLLALQRYLVHHMPDVYDAVQDAVAPLLLNLRCVIVGSLQVAYRLPTALGITISQPQPRAAALQDTDLYVEVDKLDSYTHILPELTRMFANGAVQPHLAQFLIALTLTMLSRQDVEAFMQQKGCPALPDHIPEWQTPHLAKPPPEAEEDEELDEEAAEAKMQEERLAVGEGLVGDLAAVRTKRDHSPDDSQDSEEPDSKKQKVGAVSKGQAFP
ncbi:TPA: hypothetical protein ACH3X2_005780 [Trebouxia sp. C0005]